jgi:DeoR/GlpR family transcriptional regulator of sugar metabolism
VLAKERQEKIRALVEEHKHLKISQLSRMLDVSEMTIHRDIKPLVEQGIVIKTFGGVTCAQNDKQEGQDKQSCVYCHRRVNETFSYKLILSETQVEQACCCHCGLLRHDQLGDKVIQAICYDFLTRTTISVYSAWFVMDTMVDVRCCQPQVLPFERRDYAERFVQGFGGSVHTMREAVERLCGEMHGDMNHDGQGCCHD